MSPCALSRHLLVLGLRDLAAHMAFPILFHPFHTTTWPIHPCSINCLVAVCGQKTDKHKKIYIHVLFYSHIGLLSDALIVPCFIKLIYFVAEGS